MERTYTKSKIWEEFFKEKELTKLEQFFVIHGNEAALYKCKCCNNWTACAASNNNVRFPISFRSKEEVITWLVMEGFSPIGEYTNKGLRFYTVTD